MPDWLNAYLPTLFNTTTVLVGACLGLILSHRISERFRSILFQSLGLLTLVIGFRDAIQTKALPVLAFSMIAGGLIGEAIQIERGMERLAEWLKQHIGRKGDVLFVDGFVNTTLIFCVGAMTLVGCFNAAVKGDGELLYTKGIMDGTVAIFFAGAMGMGVMFSGGSVFLIQGALTFLFAVVGSSPFLISLMSEPVIHEISASGGTVIVGIGINLLGLMHVRVANLIPAMPVAAVLTYLQFGT